MRSVFFAVLILLGTLQSAVAEEAAMLFFISGPVETKTQGSAWKPAKPLQRLKAQDQVRCAAGGQAGIVILASGARFKVMGASAATIQQGSVLGAKSLGQAGGLSARAAGKLAGSRSGAVGIRPSIKPRNLVSGFDGWLPAGTRKFTWADIPNFVAATYSFALFDRSGNVLWSVRTPAKEATVPADLPDFDTQEPILWRLTGYSEAGKPGRNIFWGIVTFLTPSEASSLQSDIAGLKDRLEAITEVQPVSEEEKTAQLNDRQVYTAAIADFYRLHGVLMGAYTLLNDEKTYPDASANANLDAIYTEAGDLARFFRGLHENAKEK